MSIPSGSHHLGPSNGELRLGTTSEGKMARMGHHLTLLVQDWSGVLVTGDQPEDSSLRVTAQLGSLKVLSGQGGATPLTEDGKTKIINNALGIMGASTHPELSFTSTAIAGSWDEGKVEGTLTVNGRSEVQQFDVARDSDGRYQLTGTITQSRYGIKPYSAMMGALLLGDDVSVEVVLSID